MRQVGLFLDIKDTELEQRVRPEKTSSTDMLEMPVVTEMYLRIQCLFS